MNFTVNDIDFLEELANKNGLFLSDELINFANDVWTFANAQRVLVQRTILEEAYKALQQVDKDIAFACIAHAQNIINGTHKEV